MSERRAQSAKASLHSAPGSALQGVHHYENFPVASFLCPPALRPAVSAIYWFARTADDLADEGDVAPQTRLADLACFRADLLACAAGQPASDRWATVFNALQPVITQFKLPVSLLADLLSAFEQDVIKTRYTDSTELLDYCRRSANPIGRLLLHLYGVRNAVCLSQSDCICTALQLINFWQDLSVDISGGRIYLPAESWLTQGVTESELLSLEVNVATTKLIQANVVWAQSLMREGSPLVRSIPGRAGWELRLVVQGGLRIAEKIEQIGFATLKTRPILGTWDVSVMAWRALWM